MYYFDNAATSVPKPPAVAEKMVDALEMFGNPGRSYHAPAMEGARCIFEAREEIAKLTCAQSPMNVAFTSGATESLNLVLKGLLHPEDGVITSVLEHNSVLRPLYQTGCQLSFIPCDGQARLQLEKLPELLKSNTKFVVCTHGSNVAGSITNVQVIKEFCQRHGLIFILDASQTLGSIPVRADMADVVCFTGHKALLGPQGTGGVLCNSGMPIQPIKTGGTGSHTFEKYLPLQWPDVLEAGTPNTPGLAGLRQGAAFINEVGVPAIQKHESTLTRYFIECLGEMPHITLYGPSAQENRLPVVSIAIDEMEADEVAMRLWEEWEIAVRPGFHCAPLVHRHFKTEEQGMVRFSFGYFNTVKEVELAIKALETMITAGRA